MFKNRKLSLLKLISVSGLILLTLGQHNPVYAIADVHFSKYRFVFDDSLRKDSLLISNRGLNAASCAMTVENFITTENGPSKIAKSPDEVPNAANKLLRYSPRRANIGPNNSQVIRLSSRRRPGVTDGEYVSYLKIVCQEISVWIPGSFSGSNIFFVFVRIF